MSLAHGLQCPKPRNIKCTELRALKCPEHRNLQYPEPRGLKCPEPLGLQCPQPRCLQYLNPVFGSSKMSNITSRPLDNWQTSALFIDTSLAETCERLHSAARCFSSIVDEFRSILGLCYLFLSCVHIVITPPWLFPWCRPLLGATESHTAPRWWS